MSENRWTPPQQNAINDRGGGLLVSAAAGSGKTAVLVERVVGIICDKDNPIDVDRLLIVTFSNAAAAEMRQRIDLRLSEMIGLDPDNHYLRRQQNLLSGAAIKTVHAFCMDLIRENFQNLPISPDFSIMDEKELELMKMDAIIECIEEFYNQDEQSQQRIFAQLVGLFSNGRDDKRLIETVFKTYNFARSHPFYADWLEEKLGLYDNETHVSLTIWGRTLLEYTKETLLYSKDQMEKTKENLLGDEVLEKAYLPAWESDIAQINNILDYINENNWDGAVGGLRSFSFERLKSVRGNDEYKEKAKATRDYVKKLIAPLGQKFMNATDQEFQEDIGDLSGKIEVLFRLVKTFGDNLDSQKQQAKKLDFSDLEHFALNLLVTKEGENYKTTPQAEMIAAGFSHVMVDEYQDTNEVQDLIFSSLSGGGDRVFMVGDVKQSIYSFRLAMPEIFIKKREHFSEYNGINYPATISLDTNFRSRKQITEGVNYIFGQIMSKNMGDINYDQKESLQCGGKFPQQPLASPEFMIVDCEENKEEDSTTLEAEAVAEKIKKMLDDEYKVADGEKLRTVVPGDFCILMRSPRTRAEVYIKALKNQGIVANADSSGGFFAAREISAVVSLLKALDNPLLDIELVAAMLSPLFSFTDDDIAEIRLADKRAPFYLAVKKSAQKGNMKCKQLLEVFSELRYFSTTHLADELILEIYHLTNWLEVTRAMPLGEGRQSNLLLLIEYANYYATMGYKGLGGFVTLLSRIKDQGGDLDSANSTGKNSNTVEIMSVHRSKGLEFPVVVIADTARRFNKRDLYENTLLHSSYGFACMRRNSQNMSQYSTIPMGAIRLEMQKTMLSEEMRILYVAMTRAKEKLVISMSSKSDLVKTINSQGVDLLPNKKLPPFVVGEANSYSEWILMALLHHQSGETLRELGDLTELEVVDDGNPWEIEIIPAKGKEEIPEKLQKDWQQMPDKTLFEKFKERIDFDYANELETKIPNKLSVSDILQREEGKAYQFARRPKALLAQKLTPTEKGNALHKFMQFADYEKAKADVNLEIQRMKKDEFLSEQEVKSLSEKALKDFFGSQLAERIFKSQKVYRELRFITEFGQKELKDSLAEEMGEESKIIVQGVADCVFIENGKAFIVDYKTDGVKDLDELLKRYEQQLTIYRQILSRTLKLPIGGCILYSFAVSSWIEI